MIKLMEVGFGQWAFMIRSNSNEPLYKARWGRMGTASKVFQSREEAEQAAIRQGFQVDADDHVRHDNQCQGCNGLRTSAGIE